MSEQQEVNAWPNPVGHRQTPGHMPAMTEDVKAIKVELRKFLMKRLNESEFRILCFDLNIDYETLAGNVIGEKIIELILQCERHSRFEELIDYCRQTYFYVPSESLEQGRPLTAEQFDARLQNIDFDEALAMFKNIFNDRAKEGAALFLMRNGTQMGGELCAGKIRDYLGGMHVHWHSFDLGTPPTDPPNKTALILQLANYLQIQYNEDIRALTQAILDKLCSSLQGNSVVLIEFKQRDRRWLEAPILGFIDHFWIPLVRRLPEISQKYSGVKFVAIFIINSVLVLDDHIRTYNESPSEHEKIYELLLRNWKQNEIEHWLALDMRLDRTTSAQIARAIYQETQGGIPQLARQALQEQLFPGD